MMELVVVIYNRIKFRKFQIYINYKTYVVYQEPYCKCYQILVNLHPALSFTTRGLFKMEICVSTEAGVCRCSSN